MALRVTGHNWHGIYMLFFVSTVGGCLNATIFNYKEPISGSSAGNYGCLGALVIDLKMGWSEEDSRQDIWKIYEIYILIVSFEIFAISQGISIFIVFWIIKSTVYGIWIYSPFKSQWNEFLVKVTTLTVIAEFIKDNIIGKSKLVSGKKLKYKINFLLTLI